MGKSRTQSANAARAAQLTLACAGVLLGGAVLVGTPTRPPGRSPELTDVRTALPERARHRGLQRI